MGAVFKRSHVPLAPESSAAMIVDGVRIDREDEVLSLVRKQIVKGTVWIDKHDQGNLDGLTRAVRDSGELLPAFARAIHQLLTDKDRSIRSGAVAMLPEVREEIGASALVDLLETRLELYYRVKPSRKFPLHYDDLAGALLVSIGRLAQPGDARSIEVLRESIRGEHAREVASSLARVDADWLCDHTTLVPRQVLGAMLLSLPTPAHRERLVRALAPWPESERELVLDKRFWDMLEADQEEVEKLKEIIGGTLHSLPRKG